MEKALDLEPQALTAPSKKGAKAGEDDDVMAVLRPPPGIQAGIMAPKVQLIPLPPPSAIATQTCRAPTQTRLLLSPQRWQQAGSCGIHGTWLPAARLAAQLPALSPPFDTDATITI